MDSNSFLQTVFKAIWMDNTPDEVTALWKHRVAVGGNFPKDALECLESAIESPPPDLVRLMQEHGWIFLTREEGGEEIPYTFEEHVAWLRQQVALLRAEYDLKNE